MFRKTGMENAAFSYNEDMDENGRCGYDDVTQGGYRFLLKMAMGRGII